MYRNILYESPPLLVVWYALVVGGGWSAHRMLYHLESYVPYYKSYLG